MSEKFKSIICVSIILPALEDHSVHCSMMSMKSVMMPIPPLNLVVKGIIIKYDYLYLLIKCIFSFLSQGYFCSQKIISNI